MGRLIRRLRYWLRQREVEAALREELELHQALKQQEFQAAGLSPDDARFAARRDLGNLTRTREDSRAVWIWPWLESILQDVRYAIRGLVAAPSFTLPALAVLVVTMGLVTSLYTVVDSVLFRPWDVPDPDRVVVAMVERTSARGVTRAKGYAEYDYLKTHAGTIALAAFVPDLRRLDGAAEPSEVRLVSGSYFDVLEIRIVAGRPLYASDDVRGAGSAVAVLSHGRAERQFGGAAQAIGARLRVDDELFTVVGVAAPGATDNRLDDRPEAWLPIASGWNLSPSARFGGPSIERYFEEPLACCVDIVGRLAPDTTARSAEAETTQLAARFAAAHGVPASTVTLHSTAFIDSPIASDAVMIFSLVSAAVLLILLLGCANVGNLLMARAAARRLDVNIRLALGATRTRLVRHLLAESFMLAAVAGLLSIGLALIVVPSALQRLGPPFEWLPLTHDQQTMLFVVALTMFVSMASGTLPALKSTRLGAAGRTVSAPPSRLRAGLLAVQVAICAVLVVGAALLARGLHYATRDGLGFAVEDVVAVRFSVRPDQYSPAEYERISAAIYEAARRSVPSEVAGTRYPPFVGWQTTRGVQTLSGDRLRAPYAVREDVTPEYFDLLRIPVLAGQPLRPGSLQGEVLVSETLAGLLWPGQQAVGREFVDADTEGTRHVKRVAGVVADVRSQQFSRTHPVYYELTTAPTTLLTRGGPADVARLREAIERVAPDVFISITDLTSRLHEEIKPALIGAGVAAAIAVLALLLAGAGTLGVVSYLVTEQIPEIGVRKALGATGRDILAMLLRGVARPMVGGLLVGLLGAQALGGVLGASLYGLSPRDPVAYVLMFTVLAAAAFLSIVGPARRAVRVDPASMLRAE